MLSLMLSTSVRTPRSGTKILAMVQRLRAVEGVKIFATSRQHYRDIEIAFETAHQVEVLANLKDLRTFITQEIEESGVDDIVDAELAKKIVDGVTSRAGGM